MVFLSAECWTDHRLVCATLRLQSVFKKQTPCRQRRYNVAPLNNIEFAKEFGDHVAQLLEVVWDRQADGETQWSVLRDCMVKTCDDFLERGRRKQPNWFTAAESFLRPMIAKCNVLFSHWLLSGRGVDRQKYLSQGRSVASAVGSSKNKWLQEKAKSIQDAL